MWAITPMLRMSRRSTVGAAIGNQGSGQKHGPYRSYTTHTTHTSYAEVRRLPGEVRERLVGVGHLDRVLPLAHGLALAAAGGQELVGQPLGHGPAALGPGGRDEPPDRQRELALRLDRDRHLVVGPADPARTHLDG